MNKFIGMGRITKDLNIETTGDTQYLRFTIAINRKGKKDETDFIPVTAFNTLAVNIQKYFAKGNLIAIEGHLQVNNFKDKDGNSRTSSTIIAESFSFTGERKNDTRDEETAEKSIAEELANIPDDDLPFNARNLKNFSP